MPFKSAHWTFLNSGDTYGSKSVNGMHLKNVSVAMVTVNIVQILDVLMIVVNAGRALEMRKQEIIYIAVDNKDADCFLDELCKPGIITDTCLRVERKKKMLETSNYQVIAISLSDFHRLTPISPVKYYLYSDKPLTTQLALLENRYYEFQVIKMHSSTFAKEIDMEKLIDILNGRRV
nr:MAG TPA: hypothetical protein [Caudoviricetes sp.]